MPRTELSVETFLSLYRQMLRIRAFEDAAEIESQGGVAGYMPSGNGAAVTGQAAVRGPLHLSTGQEAIPVGVCAHLHTQDYLTSTHRGHGHTLAKGADMTRMMCELFGKATGFNQGKGGSMHIADFSVGMLGANGVVAAGLPIAVGAAHAQKLLRNGETPVAITACFFGDGAINRGPFLESLNWAQVYQLPVLFVCEDNRWSATTATATTTAGDASTRAASVGMPTLQVDGNDVLAVYRAAQELVADIRAGRGPRLLHAITYRVKGHVSVDPASYRDPAELQAALQHDPIEKFAQFLKKNVALAHMNIDLNAIKTGVATEVETALHAARHAPWPDAREAYIDVQTLGAGQWH